MVPDSSLLVVFRVDASINIGTGHVMRCLTLANLLRKSGVRCAFICRQLPAEIAAEISDQKHEIFRLTSAAMPIEAGIHTAHASWLGTSQQADAEESVLHIRKMVGKPSWLVVDHYALDAEWERSLQPHVQRILAIDDLADRRHECDVLLDQNLHINPTLRYRNRVKANCVVLVGPRYALLRPEFAKLRHRAINRKGAVKRLLVSMGGIDLENDTMRIIDAFLALKRDDLFLDVIASITNPNLQTLSKACEGRPNIALHAGTTTMAQFMAAADLAIGAGGISNWERCCLGLPTLVIATAANQEPGCHVLAREGAILYSGPRAHVSTSVIHTALSTLLHDPDLRQAMAQKSAALVDGLGTERVTQILLASPLHLRSAAEADSADILMWRNHEDTRRYSGNSQLITETEHQRWFKVVLADPARRVLIGEQDGRPVGVLRYDMAEDEALVSIYLVPGNSGRGLGPHLLAAGERWLTDKASSVHRIRAHVQQANVPSMRAFEAAGFERHGGDFLKVLRRYDD